MTYLPSPKAIAKRVMAKLSGIPLFNATASRKLTKTLRTKKAKNRNRTRRLKQKRKTPPRASRR